MSVAGFLLAGGQSRRMGQDKALLPFRGRPLALSMLERLASVAHPVILLGDPQRYQHLGVPVWPDLHPDHGPLEAICGALERTSSDWNLFVPVDLPAFPPAGLQQLLAEPRDNLAAIVAHPAPGPLQALAGVYHRNAAPALRQCLTQGERAPKRALLSLAWRPWTTGDPRWFRNCNTPEEWEQLLDGHHD